MKLEWGFGGLWPRPGLDAIHVTEAIYRARPLIERRIGRRPMDWNAPERARQGSLNVKRSSTLLSSSATGGDDSARWTVDGAPARAASFFTGTMPSSAREARDQAHEASRREGRVPWWSMEVDYFPFYLALTMESVRRQEVKWSVRDEYFWVARNVFIPRGWASFMHFRYGTPRDTWGTVPGHPEPVRLPDDFMTHESPAWTLFDNPDHEEHR